MIKLFRNIRKKLLSEGKTANYLKYAIGEIVLVVIGILIALQINNWNEHRKELQKESVIVKELYKELQQNLKATTKHRQQIEEINQEVLFLLNISDDSLKLLTNEDLNQHIFNSSLISPFTPFNQKLKRILAIENFGFSHSKTLVNELQDYNNSIEGISSINLSARDVFKNRMVPFLSENLSLKNLMHEIYPEKITKNDSIVDVGPIIKSMAFENLYADLFASYTSYIFALERNIELTKNLITHIEKAYPSVISTK
ncbi:DUF6090 family protein [Muricauda sp. 334s03]|uniref:DUF6090 family protein n=1 Tax=Flagellimonas yonaguniensis TaxID=3031325 RepID=A0ABT5Y1U0_9FLAO|nr:DUF6090 family protein [[Muricauda] yonaguniensis]MDF0717405.1 DUF6090 family protein [[Muricauda] yonaguniensis]